MNKNRRKIVQKQVDPFAEIAAGLSIGGGDVGVWEEEPVEIQEFIESPHFLNLKWNGRRGCRPKIMEIAKALSRDEVREAILLLGKGSCAFDTKIRLASGESVAIADLYYDYQKTGVMPELICKNLKDGTIHQRYGIPKYSGVKELVEVTLENGYTIRVTHNHDMLVGDHCESLENLNIGDSLPVIDEKFLDSRIISIKTLEKEHVFDITIQASGLDNEFANYCADGVFISNSGKDFISSILQLYGIYKALCMHSPQTYYGLSTHSPIYFVNVARNEDQAKNVFFKEFLGHLTGCPWFEGKYDEPGTRQVGFSKNIYALSGNSQAFGWLGYNTIQWVGDELAFFLAKDKDDDDGESKAEECWEAAFGSCKTRFPNHYKMIGITTPRFDDDFVMRKFYELKRRMEEDGDSFTAQAATWDINPLMTKEDFRHSLARDFRRTMRDYGAQPMGVIETFWGDPDFVDKNVCDICKSCPIYQNRTESSERYACYEYEDCRANGYKGNGEFRDWFFPENYEDDYYLHIDLSKNKDKTAISMCHIVDWVDVQLDPYEMVEKMQKEKLAKGIELAELDYEDKFEEKAIVQVDFIAYVDPVVKRDPNLLKNGEVYYTGILKHIIMGLIQRGFSISKVTVDSYQSHMFKQSLEDLSIETDLLSLDRTDEVPVKAKACFVENRVIYPYDRVFAREARHLKYINGRKVDHPTGKGKDIIDSVFGCVYNAETEETGKGVFEIFGIGNYED